LILVHFVDHDAEAHENGPFSRAAVAKIEYTDELIGGVLSVLPDEYVVALVSDHGFERTNRIIDVDALVGGDNKGVAITAHVLTASTPAAADRIRNLARESKNGIGREIPVEELRRFTGAQFADAVAAWEPAEHVVFGRSGEKLREKGNHGFWPLRRDYRSVFVLWGTGIARRRLPEMPMTGIAARLAKILELPFSPN
jgi:predicted AlkP superfamily pyrophosphatase or phosphodiesterase